MYVSVSALRTWGHIPAVRVVTLACLVMGDMQNSIMKRAQDKTKTMYCIYQHLQLELETLLLCNV